MFSRLLSAIFWPNHPLINRFTEMSRPVMVVCFDCCGDDPIARRTYLYRDTCASCGGRSFMLASTYASMIAVNKALLEREAEVFSRKGK